MSENEQKHDNDAEMENNVVSIIIAGSMKNGWFQTTNNAVFYHQTHFNTVVILEQVSNCDILLREQMSTE